MKDIVDAIPYGANAVLSILEGQVTDGKGGELFVWKASNKNTIHKTHIVLRSTGQSTDSLVNQFFIGYVRYDASLPCQWYKLSLVDA
jgi:hypothetical protein